MAIKKVSVRDLSAELIDEYAAQVALNSVAFARATALKDDTRLQLLGSGTLVQHANGHGILTARHVAEAVSAGPEVAIVLHRSRHRFSIETGYLTIISSSKGAKEENGPDIAFIGLPETRVGTIKAVRSFVNLEVHKRRAVEHERDKGLWCMFGFPNEKATILPRSTTIFYGEGSIGPPPERYSTSVPFDYFWVRARYSEANNLPRSYGGVSGGGLWQSGVFEDRGTVRTALHVLRGVAFYQTPRRGDYRLIKCHGDASIYSWLLAELERRYQ